jgi:hypothetical protein
MVKWISSSWQNYLNTEYPQDHRVYINFRGVEYPPVLASGTYTLVTEADNRPGSHNMTGGYNTYFLELTSVVSITSLVKPTCAYNVSTKQAIWSWYYTASRYLSCHYISSQFVVEYAEGSTARTLVSDTYADSKALQVWTTIGATLSLGTATSSGSVLYVDGVSKDTAWDDDIVARTSYYPVFQVRALNAAAGAMTINNVRMLPGIAAGVTDDFKTRKEEEIYWPLNGHGAGHTRCNVSTRVTGIDIGRSIESPMGQANPNTLNVELMSPGGEFSDDQYAAFDPAAEVYNGTSSQKYMQTRCPIEVETWYGGTYEPEFVGRIDDGVFQRRSGVGDISRVSVGALDRSEDMKRRTRQRGKAYDSYELCNTSTSTTSLLHTIAKMESQPEWYNFVANSSFENATAANSWVVTGTSATVTRAAGGLVGSYQLDWLVAGMASTMGQQVTYSSTKKLNVGQNWNFSIYGKAATAFNCVLRLNELAVGGTSITTNAAATASFTAGTGWVKMEKTVTISTSATAILQPQLYSLSTATLNVDCAMLVQNNRSLPWFVLNNNDGAAGVESADDADSGVYDTMGFDVDDAMIVHPWARVEQGESIWEYLTQIGDATAARYIGMDSAGTLKYRTIFKTSYADPSAIATIDATQNIDTVLDIEQANKILVHGVSIQKDTMMRQVWDAAAAGCFTADGTSWIRETVANGASWPTALTSNDFWASYGDVT